MTDPTRDEAPDLDPGPADLAEPADDTPRLPYGSWPSPIRIEDIVGEVVRLSEPWIDGDDVYWIEGRPTEAGRSVLVHRAEDGTTADLTPAPFDVRTRSTNTAAASYTVAGGTTVFSHRARWAVVPAGPRRRDARADHAGRTVPLRRPALRCAAGGGSWPIREDHTRRRTSPRRRSSPCRSMASASRSSSCEGPDFLRRPALSPDGASLAWLEWDHPDMPWDATRLRLAPVKDDGSLGPSTWPPAARTSRSPSPSGRPTGCCISSATGVAGGTCTASSTARGWSRSPRWTPSSPIRPGCSTGRRYGFLPDGSIAAVGRARGRDRLFHIAPGPPRRRGRDAVHRDRRRCASVRARSSRSAASPTEASMVVAFDPEDAGTGRGAAPVQRRWRSIRPGSRSPEAITFPTAGGRVAHALFYPPHSPDVGGAGRGAAAARGQLARRADRERGEHRST